MATPENPKVGGCYIWTISFLLFIFTVSGAVFLLLYVTQPETKATSWYALIGVTLVFLPWFFWFFTFCYRVMSRNCGFRMVCFGSSGSGYPDDNVGKNVPAVNSNGISNNVVTVTVAHEGVANDEEANFVDGNEDENGNGEPTSPRRVTFGGVVILGEGEEANTVENEGSPKVLSRSSSSSSSSSSRHSNNSETPLRLSMA